MDKILFTHLSAVSKKLMPRSYACFIHAKVPSGGHISPHTLRLKLHQQTHHCPAALRNCHSVSYWYVSKDELVTYVSQPPRPRTDTCSPEFPTQACLVSMIQKLQRFSPVHMVESYLAFGRPCQSCEALPTPFFLSILYLCIYLQSKYTAGDEERVFLTHNLGRTSSELAISTGRIRWVLVAHGFLLLPSSRPSEIVQLVPRGVIIGSAFTVGQATIYGVRSPFYAESMCLRIIDDTAQRGTVTRL